jgi:hypothetical protein
MGFPPNYTQIEKGKDIRDRHKALGNSMAVPVMEWIGRRINLISEQKENEMSEQDAPKMKNEKRSAALRASWARRKAAEATGEPQRLPEVPSFDLSESEHRAALSLEKQFPGVIEKLKRYNVGLSLEKGK